MTRRRAAGLALPCLTWAAALSAHPASPHENALPWTWDAWITLPLLLSLAAFVLGALRLRARGHPPPRRCIWRFAAGWFALAAALVSPLHAAGERSFLAHMAEHELIMLVAALLLASAHAHGVLLWAFGARTRSALVRAVAMPPLRAVWRRITQPVTATLLQALVLWLWHAPALFDLGLAHPGWHAVQHLSFLVSAWAFWTAMLDRTRRRRQPVLLLGCLFATTTLGGALGALMAFASSPWYAGYRALGVDAFGLDPTQDQQLAGLLMWVPGGLVHLGAALVLLSAVLREPTRRARVLHPSVGDRAAADAPEPPGSAHVPTLR